MQDKKMEKCPSKNMFSPVSDSQISEPSNERKHSSFIEGNICFFPVQSDIGGTQSFSDEALRDLKMNLPLQKRDKAESNQTSVGVRLERTLIEPTKSAQLQKIEQMNGFRYSLAQRLQLKAINKVSKQKLS